MTDPALKPRGPAANTRRLTALYISALSAIALLTIAGQISVQWSLAQQYKRSTVINIAGRQRMLSQKITKTALLISRDENPAPALIRELESNVADWKRAHLALQQGDASLELPQRNSPAVRELFNKLAPHHDAILAGARQVADGDAQAGTLLILAHEPAFLKTMDAIVFQYDLESQDEIAALKRLEQWLLATTLVVLLTEGFLVFRPAVRRIETTLKQLALAKQVAEDANQEKSRFLARMSHDLRTPLNAILGLLDIVLQQPKQSDRERLLTIRDAAEALLRLVTDLLDTAQFEAGGKPRVVIAATDVRDLVRRTVKVFEKQAADRGLQLVCDISHEMPDGLMTDAGIVQRIVMNLVSNAVKFTDQGEVRVALQAERQSDNSYQVKLVVRDTGLGIASEDQSRVFEGFTQLADATGRPREGVGLGLSIVQRLVTTLDGTVTLQSELGRGSTFTVLLPMAKAAARQATSTAVASLSQRKRVLVVEDTDLNQVVYREMLATLGHDCEIVGTGQEGLQAAERGDFDIVLLDLQLPDVNGLDLVRQFRALPGYATKPIIAISAHALDEYRERSMAAGFTQFLSKPVRLTDMETLLGKAASPSRWEGRASLLQSLARMFSEQWPVLLIQLGDAVERGDIKQAQFLAHRMKGLVSNFEDPHADATIRQLESAADDADLARLPALQAALHHALEQLDARLHETSQPGK